MTGTCHVCSSRLMSDSCMYVPRVRTSCSLLKVVTCMCALQPTEGYHVYVSVCHAIDCCLPRTCLYAPRVRTSCTRLVSATGMCVPHPTAVVNVVSRHARSRQCAPSVVLGVDSVRTPVCHGVSRCVTDCCVTNDLRLNGTRTSRSAELCRSQQLVISYNDVR
jgi:hypothetical protein